MNIRKAQKKDRNQCLEIIISCLRKVNIKDYSTEVIETLVDRYTKYFMKRRKVYTIIIEENEKILGTASIANNGQIRDVFIDISNHRKGLGSILMEELENFAKLQRIKKVFLYAAISSKEFYIRLGYIEIERADFGETGIQIRMEKKI